MTVDADRAALISIARTAIVEFVTRSGRSGGAAARSDELRKRFSGVFVTLHHRGDLRGCIGRLEADRPLPELVAECAISACSSDPRFSPVTSEELADLAIELSILGLREPVASLDDVEVGRHGLLIERGRHRGLLLPQVAAERRWDRRTFLEQTCRKAGLEASAWQDGATLWRFEAEVFS
jgi:AmmeMemoRadiSam system protein A